MPCSTAASERCSSRSVEIAFMWRNGLWRPTHTVIDLAPGVKLTAWTFGDQAPCPRRSRPGRRPPREPRSPLDGAGRSASDADGVRLIEENAMAKKSQRSGRKSASGGTQAAHDDARAGEERNNVDGDEKQEASAAKMGSTASAGRDAAAFAKM